MEIIYIIAAFLLAYFIGSIPSAVWYGQYFHKIDVRQHGSGNAGATNTFRVLGKKAGMIVMFFDALKGFVSTNLAHVLESAHLIDTEHLMLFKLMFGIAAVLGHIFPIYARFKGGKGIATLLGMVLSIQIEPALICIAVFLIVFLLFKYVSLGSILSSLAFPIILLLPRFNPHEPLVIVFAFVIFSIVIITHQKNIVRLLHGEENKIKIGVRKDKDLR